ncbi:hypothetical protein C5167_042920 [Papaver somniferum]|uniref:Glycine-rich protein n=1 Tax=Papaver somniferum TaxID=3469 RepID=A0A4Y7L463_PAPSO|nr:hypothetical protein C5167_042920 [Papaver somniferum]
MDRGRGGRGGGRDDFFGGGFGGCFGGDPFAGIGGFGGDPFAGMGGFGGHQSLMASFFGGRDPFDSPFFNRPFGGGGGNSMFGPSMFGQSMFGESMIGPSMFGANGGGAPRDAPASGFIQNVLVQENKQGGGLVIQEINSDDEEEEAKQEVDEQKDNPRKHSRSSKKHMLKTQMMQLKVQISAYTCCIHLELNGHNRVDSTQPQTKSFSYQSSTVTYGGVNGAYYTSSTSRKMVGDGVVVEESKEADTTTGKAYHRLSRGIHDKGHSVTRKLNPDGKVDTTQTLHNLEEDELPVFEKAWNGTARKHLPGWGEEGFSMQADNGERLSNRGQAASSQGWALPSTKQPQRSNPEDSGTRVGLLVVSTPACLKGLGFSRCRVPNWVGREGRLAYCSAEDHSGRVSVGGELRLMLHGHSKKDVITVSDTQ